MTTPVPSLEINGGVGDTYVPWTIPPNKWYSQFGMRTRPYGVQGIMQGEEYASWGNGGGNGAPKQYCLMRIPDTDLANGMPFARLFFSDKSNVFWYDHANSILRVAYIWGDPYSPGVSAVESPIRFFKWGDLLFIIGPNRSLAYLKSDPAETDSDPGFYIVPNAPSGVCGVVFYEHIFVCGGYYKGSSERSVLRWCALKDYTKWDPAVSHEGDYFDMANHVANVSDVADCNGLFVRADTLYVITAAGIVPVKYVGKPKIIQVSDPIREAACTDPASFIDYGRGCAFYDSRQAKFFVLDANGIVDITKEARGIGASVWDGAFDFGYYYPELDSLVWVTKSGAGLFYSFNEKAFYIDTGLLHAPPHKIYKQWGALAGTIGALSGTIAALHYISSMDFDYGVNLRTGPVLDVIYGSTNLSPYVALETGDRIYGSLTQMKELHGITIHGGSVGISVKIHVRNNLSDPVSWNGLTAYTWTPTLPQKMLTFPPKRGRIFRIQYVFTDTTTVPVVNSIEEHVTVVQ